MSHSIVTRLVLKDLYIMRKIIAVCMLVSLASFGVVSVLWGRLPNWALINIAFTLLAAPAATCGIVLLVKTNVLEKEKATQSFIMSLPVTARQFVLAKLLANVPVFTVIWLAVTAVALFFSFGLELFPLGTLPMLLMIFLGVYVAYTCILSVSLITQSLGATILSILGFEIATVATLWTIGFQKPIAENVYGTHPVWNGMSVSVVAAQLAVIVLVLVGTWMVQSRKRDFV